MAKTMVVFYITIGLIFLLIIGTALAEVWIPFDSQEPVAPTFQVISDSNDSTIIAGTIHGMYVDTVTIDEYDYLSFHLHDSETPGVLATLTELVGYPAVVSYVFMIQIPNGKDFQVSIKNIDALDIDFPEYPLIATFEPQKENEQQTPQIDMLPEVYEQDEYWPESILEVDSSEPEYMRSVKFIRVRVNFPYNPLSRTVRAIPQFKICMDYQGTGSNPWDDKAISYSFNQLFQASIVNYKPETQEIHDFSPGILIITTPESADSAFSLQDHYLSMGHITYVETVSTIPDTADVKNIIYQYYQQQGIEAAILMGTIPLRLTASPVFPLYYSIWTASYYGHMDNDYWEDLFITMLPVAEGVRNIKKYQKTPPRGQWAKTVLHVAHQDTTHGRRYHIPKEIIRSSLLQDYTVINAFGIYGSIIQTIKNAIENQGIQWLNYRGHGNGYGWNEVGPDGSFMIEDIISLDPCSDPFVLMNICCWDGAIQAQDTVATEQWMKGPVVLTTSGTAATYTEINHVMDKMIFGGLFSLGIDDWVSAVLFGKNWISANCNTSRYLFGLENAWWYPTFGGPYTNVWREIPRDNLLAVDYPDTLWPWLEDSCTVDVTIGIPLSNARVVLYSREGNIFSKGITDPSGHCQLNFYPQCWEGEAQFCVYAENYRPFVQAIPIKAKSVLQNLSIERLGGGTIRLSWRGVPENLLERYVIFRSDKPVFEPTQMDSFACTQDTMIVLNDLPECSCFLVVARMPDSYCDDLMSIERAGCFNRYLQDWK
jgi:hypothetical protein